MEVRKINVQRWSITSQKSLESVVASVQANVGKPNMTDGAGDHARAGATWLGGVHPKKTEGADIHSAITVDQILAKEIGSETALPSLELGLEDVRMVGGCDSGDSCAYSNTISCEFADHSPALRNQPTRGV